MVYIIFKSLTLLTGPVEKQEEGGAWSKILNVTLTGRGAGVPRCSSAGAEDAGTGSQEKPATVEMMQNKTDKA